MTRAQIFSTVTRMKTRRHWYPSPVAIVAAYLFGILTAMVF